MKPSGISELASSTSFEIQLVTLVVGITILQFRRQNEDDSKTSTIKECRTRLEMIWNDLPQKPVSWAVQNFPKQM